MAKILKKKKKSLNPLLTPWHPQNPILGFRAPGSITSQQAAGQMSLDFSALLEVEGGDISVQHYSVQGHVIHCIATAASQQAFCSP